MTHLPHPANHAPTTTVAGNRARGADSTRREKRPIPPIPPAVSANHASPAIVAENRARDADPIRRGKRPIRTLERLPHLVPPLPPATVAENRTHGADPIRRRKRPILKLERLLALSLAVLLFFSARAEGIVTDATVAAGTLVPVFAAAGGVLESVSVQAGDLVHAGDPAARVEVTRIYSPIDGTVNGLFLELGADASAGLYLEPKETYAMTGSTTYADATGEDAWLRVGSAVTLSCTRDSTHIGAGILLSVDGSTFSVLPTAGEFFIGEAVNVYAETEAGTARIGRATVARAEPVKVSGEGTVTRLLVADGARVMKGQALFETVSSQSGTPETTCPVDGIVTEVRKAIGEAVSEGELLFYLAPEDDLILTVSLPEAEAATLSVGDSALAIFAFDTDEHPYEATVLSVSSSATQTDDGPRYEARLRLLSRPDELRLGMNATVYVP